jgi:S-adenosylmethionine hydrolase
MKKLLPILLFLICLTASAQLKVGNIDLNFGETIENKDGDVIKIAGENNNIIYTLSRKKKKFFYKHSMPQLKHLKAVLYLNSTR